MDHCICILYHLLTVGGEVVFIPDDTVPPRRDSPPETAYPHNGPTNQPPTPPIRTPSPQGPSRTSWNDADSEDEDESNSQVGHGIGSGNPDLLDTPDITVHLEELKSTLAAIREIENASSSTQFEGDGLHCLRNPVTEERTLRNTAPLSL